MAAIDKVKREQAKRNRSGTTKKSEPVKKARTEPVKRAKKRPLTGLEKLQKAADRVLARCVTKIAKELEKSARDGKLSSTKYLVTLAEKKKPDAPVKDARLHDYISQLASEAQWKAEQEGGFGEVGEGGLEPEF